ncbi:hypothetical protein QBC46DRAFT_371778 [Diplogelasinospora grovesii]|uniref:Uncharacterized protein n=1 Tax=Diplogelasinospora grovesii TaxID=303347 RepID=A0AAN6NGE5_9PEZI|nr:hypothetical protein QBC46DRAFT_371778 [Diplogelasinospora grovesii]
MRMMASPSHVSDNRKDAARREQSTIYKLIMTPIILTSFIISLVIVDIRNTVRRSHYHSDGAPWLPHWLRRLVYRHQQPFRYVQADGGGQRAGSDNGVASSDWYYHSKQCKLMKMETEDAFQIRNTVLGLMALVGLGVAWAAWRVLSWGVSFLVPLFGLGSSALKI